jgi:hypothetical protein
MHWRVEMSAVPLLLIDGHNLLFRACFCTPAQIWSRDEHDKRELTKEFVFFALLRKDINAELPGTIEDRLSGTEGRRAGTGLVAGRRDVGEVEDFDVLEGGHAVGDEWEVGHPLLGAGCVGVAEYQDGA